MTPAGVDPVWPAGIAAAYLVGAYCGLLIAVALFHALAYGATRDSSIPWYFGFLAMLFGIETLRDQLLPWDTLAPPTLVLSGMDVVGGTALLIFVAVYLRLWQDARTLLWRMLWGTIPFWSTLVLTIAVPSLHPYTESMRAASGASGLIVGFAVASARLRGGFTPASYLIVAFFGLGIATEYRFLAEHGFALPPAFDRWIFEGGTAFDVLLFTLAIMVRVRYVFRERRLAERSLRSSADDAEHDPLTGLLNRRGLERFVRERGAAPGYVLFVDLHGFQAVNERGGHAVGDATLILVAAVMRRMLRKRDVLARLGGDQFVIVMNGADERVARDRARAVGKAIAEIAPLGKENPTRLDSSIGIAPLGKRDALQDAVLLATPVRG